MITPIAVDDRHRHTTAPSKDAEHRLNVEAPTGTTVHEIEGSIHGW